MLYSLCVKKMKGNSKYNQKLVCATSWLLSLFLRGRSPAIDECSASGPAHGLRHGLAFRTSELRLVNSPVSDQFMLRAEADFSFTVIESRQGIASFLPTAFIKQNVTMENASNDNANTNLHVHSESQEGRRPSMEDVAEDASNENANAANESQRRASALTGRASCH